MAPISDIERQVFTDIYETYSGKLYGVCLHYVKDHEIAEDLLHDSFIVIFAGIGSLRDPARLESWMCSIVRNIALKHLKVSQRMQETNIDSIPDPILEDNTTHFTEIPLNELLTEFTPIDPSEEMLIDIMTFKTFWYLVFVLCCIMFVWFIYNGVMMLFDLKYPSWRPGMVLFIAWLMSIFAIFAWFIKTAAFDFPTLLIHFIH